MWEDCEVPVDGKTTLSHRTVLLEEILFKTLGPESHDSRDWLICLLQY